MILLINFLLLMLVPYSLPEDMITIAQGCINVECHSKSQKTAKKICVEKFQIDRTEVTVEQYKKCVDARICKEPSKNNCLKSSYHDSTRANHPVNCVSWNDADAFCTWAGKRLPTEAEWEVAARGDTQSLYAWGNENPKESGCINDSKSSLPVCSNPKCNSANRICDMSTNVWEWVSDWFDENRCFDSAKKEKCKKCLKEKVIKGGDFQDDSARKISFRFKGGMDLALPFVGFRCAKDFKPF
jgi:formylglycine-generating enzyme required for sulfatase activity